MRISKKIIALIMAIILAFSLLACSNISSGGTASPSADMAASPSPSAPAAASPSVSAAALPSAGASASPSAGIALSKQGYYDPNKNYNARKQYKIAFLIESVPTSMHQMFIKAYGSFGAKLNYTLKDFTANDDPDLYVNTLQTLATQGYDGYFLDFGTDIQDRVFEVIKELKLTWFPGLSSYRDGQGNLLSPTLTIDNEKYGEDMTTWLDKTAKTTWGKFDNKQLGMISVDFSIIPDIHAREQGAHKMFQKLYPDIADTNYWVADGAVQNSFTADAAYNLVGPILSAHPDIKYWIIASAMDDFANGAARAAEGANKQDNTLVIAMGGTTMVAQWDKGMTSCWKASIYYEANLAAQTVCAGLVSMIDGDTTPTTLWPKWIQSGQKYPMLLAPCYLLTHDNYQDFFAWVNNYTGLKLYEYPDKGVKFEYGI